MRRSHALSGSTVWASRPWIADPPTAVWTVAGSAMSATKQGTPASDSRPARPWTVLVLPVPVAPATSPCRFTMASGTATSKPVATSSPLTARPGPTAGASNP